MAEVRGGHQSRAGVGVGGPSDTPPGVPTGQSCPWRVHLRSLALGIASWAAVPRPARLPTGTLHAGWTGSEPGADGRAGEAGGEGSVSHARRKLPGASGLFGSVTRPCPQAEGGASLLGGSAWVPTPGRAYVQPELWPARSHTGTAGLRRCGAPPTRGSWPGRAATARRPAARRGRSSGAGSARRCGKAPTRRGRPRTGAAAASLHLPPCSGTAGPTS